MSTGVQMLEEININHEKFARADGQTQDAPACYKYIKKQIIQPRLYYFLEEHKF